MSRLHCGRQTTVAVLGRLVALDEEEPDGSFSAELSPDEAEIMAAAIAEGGHAEFEVRGQGAAPRDAVSIEQALSAGKKRPGSTTTTEEAPSSGN